MNPPGKTPGQRVKELLDSPKVQDLISDENNTTQLRRNAPMPRCRVFDAPCSRLVPDERFVFSVDREAAETLPDIINNKAQGVVEVFDPDEEKKAEYNRTRSIGIVFSGGPAPGGHNVIAGIYDAAKKVNPDTRVFGFLLGPDGVIEGEVTLLDDQTVDKFRNQGGFGMIKTGRTKIDSREKVTLSRETLQELGLDSLVVVGGDDSNTNAAFLAQELINDGIQVIGVPKTIDGDIQVRDDNGNVLCAMSFGFHTAARAFANSVSNLCTDASSDVKYWHVCKVMGRVASHLALEVGLQTHATLTFVGEDLADYLDKTRLENPEGEVDPATLDTLDYTAFGMTLRHLSRLICNSIVRRAAVGKNYGVIVLPEGVLEFINEIQVFIIKLNTIIADYNELHDTGFHADFLTLDDKLDYLRRLARRSREDKTFTIWNTRDDDLFNDIPAFFQEGLLMERDAHGNFPFSQVQTERVVIGLVRDYLSYLREEGEFRVGIRREYYEKTMKRGGLDPDRYGDALFENYQDGDFLLTQKSIISKRTLTLDLDRAGLLDKSGKIPSAVLKIYKKATPSFKTQTHFFGYDGRGSEPTWFDATYGYNLGLTVFALLANGATGQMAAIRNLEFGFEHWAPMGIPIAPLMHLEERKGKLALVLEKTIVDTQSAAFLVARASRERWLAAHPGPDAFRKPGPIRFSGIDSEYLPITLALNAIGRKPD